MAIATWAWSLKLPSTVVFLYVSEFCSSSILVSLLISCKHYTFLHLFRIIIAVDFYIGFPFNVECKFGSRLTVYNGIKATFTAVDPPFIDFASPLDVDYRALNSYALLFHVLLLCLLLVWTSYDKLSGHISELKWIVIEYNFDSWSSAFILHALPDSICQGKVSLFDILYV